MNRGQAVEEYNRALKQGQREYRDATAAGRYPYLPALDEVLENATVESYLPVGLVEIPISQIVGTKTMGRTSAFSSGFMPLLGRDTEFATKWISLCAAHVDEGIRDPIRVFEYRMRFYVQEGNKRVSVLKYFGADSIAAHVTRVVPQYSSDPETRLYYEFMDFYRLSNVYYLTFTQEGSYARLQSAMGKKTNQAWTADDRTEMLSLFNWVKKAYLAHGGAMQKATVADVLLVLLRVYPYDTLRTQSPAELAKSLDSVWEDVVALAKPIALSTAPSAKTAQQPGLLDWILPTAHPTPSHLKVAFVNTRNPQTSTWTNAHEFGRTQLDNVFDGKVQTCVYNEAVPGENADELMEQAIADGADVVFTTSPQLVGASLRAAARHPDVKILNCSMDMPYASIRTYYSRVYEAKFVTGMVAGAMAAGDTIGYIANYPIFGVPANINAFALGARMTNPRARIELEWTCLPGDALEIFARKGITVISGRDTPVPGRPQREFGTFMIRPGGSLQDLASPFWHWGQYYENVVRCILDGGWDHDNGRAINYWWGMNSGVIDVLLSRELPDGVRQMADILRRGITTGSVDPFACRITAQGGLLKNTGLHGLSPDEILHMDWLCDNVDGHIPEYEELSEVSRSMYRMQGLHRDAVDVQTEVTP